MLLAIDFDEVIHDKSNPLAGKRMGAPMGGAKEAISNFVRRGDKVIVLTVMATNPHGQKAVEEWMRYYGIPFHEVTAIKPNADIFIDDKAIRHVDWKNTIEVVNEIRTVQNLSR